MKHICVIVFFIACNHIHGQDYQLIKHFSVQDGLPSNEVYDGIQDDSGYIWLATDRGLVRYDGYEFITYGAQSGLGDIVCLLIRQDKANNIWVNTLSDGLYKFDRLTETFYHFDIIEKRYKSKSTPHITDFYVDDNNIIHASLHGQGIVRFADTQRLVGEDLPRTPICFTYLYSIDSVKLSVHVIPDSISKSLTESYFLLHEKFIPLKPSKTSDLIPYNNPFSINDTTLVQLAGKLHVVYDSSYSSLDHPTMTKFGRLNNDKILATSSFYNQSRIYNSINTIVDKQYISVFTDKYCNSFLEDDKENIWLFTMNQGVFVYKQSNRFITNDNTQDIAVTDDKKIYYLQNNKIYSEETIISVEQPVIRYIGALNNSLFYSTSKSSYIRDTSSSLIHACHNDSLALSAAKFAGQSEKYPLILVKSRSISLYGNVNECESNYIHDPSKHGMFTGLTVKDEQIFFSSTTGLWRLHNDTLQETMINYRLNAATFVNDLLFVATQGYGIQVYDGRSIKKYLSLENGLLSNNIESLSSYQNDYLIANTKNGISVINIDSTEIINYTLDNGLSALPINEYAILNDSIYCASSGGIDRIPIKRPQDIIKRPVIQYTTVNGVKSTLSGLSWNDNNIIIKFVALDVSRFGQIKYRYKFNDQPYITTDDTHISLYHLPSGSHKLQISALSIDGVLSDATVLTFNIQPKWYRTGIFRLLSTILSLLLITIFFIIYKRRKEYEVRIINQKNDLERAALQAQMNPHFVFNVLNSIQNYIMKNERESAMNYLGTFAKLVRQNLNASIDKSIAIQDEIQMLKSYLELEQLRFKNKFDYKITVDDTINDRIDKIPAMLIQPHVENAIIHGMKHITDKGFIQVTFRNESQNIVVDVQDNGKGVSTDTTQEHISHGQSITKRRLALLHGTLLEDNISVVSSTSGTTVTIVIPK